ncbi:hypothetical protein KKA15_02505 [Patescibacteria group bacterium]|nr:hypothetical protein [Patescibacteria group bacterium]
MANAWREAQQALETELKKAQKKGIARGKTIRDFVIMVDGDQLCLGVLTGKLLNNEREVKRYPDIEGIKNEVSSESYPTDGVRFMSMAGYDV